MLSTNFINHCALCRARIYDPSKIRQRLRPALASSFARLGFYAFIEKKGISRVRKAQRLENIRKSLRGDKSLHKDRIMVVWNEFLDKMCNEPATPDEGNPAAIREHRVIGNWIFGVWDQISRSFLLEDPVEVLSWLCFYNASLLVAAMGLWGGDKAGNDKTKIEMFASSEKLFIGWMVGLVTSTSRTPWGWKIIPSAVVFVLMVKVLVLLAGVFLVEDLRGVEVPFRITYHRGLEGKFETGIRF